MVNLNNINKNIEPSPYCKIIKIYIQNIKNNHFVRKIETFGKLKGRKMKHISWKYWKHFK